MFKLASLQKFLCALNAKRFIIAYSGGLDSHVLLHAVASLRQTNHFELLAVHINHGLSDNAHHWQRHCAEVCDELGIPFMTETIVVDSHDRKNFEALARDGRYTALKNYCRNGDVVLTAHHQDDQIETLLLQLLRGAGLAGLASMPVIKPFGVSHLVRPLLRFSRQDLQQYAEEQQLVWVEDESNLSTSFARNYLRHEVMPLIDKRWSLTTIARSAQHCQEALAILNEVAAEDLQNIMPQNTKLSIPVIDENEDPVSGIIWSDDIHAASQNRINLKAWQCLSPARQRQVLRYWLQQLGLALPSTARLYECQRQLNNTKQDAAIKICWGNVECRHYRNQIYVFKELAVVPKDWSFVWTNENSPTQRSERLVKLQDDNLLIHLQLPANIGVLKLTPALFKSYQLNPNKPITIKFRQRAERFKLAGSLYSTSLKKHCQSVGIPPWLRNYLPILVQDNQIKAILNP